MAIFKVHNTFFVFLKMYNRGWARSRRVLDYFFTILAEISGRYW